MHRGTIYIDENLKDVLLEYLEDKGWIIESEEHFKRKGIDEIVFFRDYNEIVVQIEKGQKIEIDGRRTVISEIDQHFNGKDTLLITDI